MSRSDCVVREKEGVEQAMAGIVQHCRQRME